MNFRCPCCGTAYGRGYFEKRHTPLLMAWEERLQRRDDLDEFRYVARNTLDNLARMLESN